MTTQQLTKKILKKRSFLCIGLDPDLNKIPPHLLSLEDPIFEFNKAIIDATHDLAVAFKPNTAFYESLGLNGWKSLSRTIDYLNTNHPDIFTIADAKRGDIGNTSTMYAKAFFEQMDFDSITVAPYMGSDSVEPFLAFEDKFAILLALTSNPGAFDFQTAGVSDDELYLKVISTAMKWNGSQRLMFVVGATKASYFESIRKVAPSNFLLVPGVGAQGGNLQDVCKYGMTDEVGLLINSSRAIIYASASENFALAARAEALDIRNQMDSILTVAGL